LAGREQNVGRSSSVEVWSALVLQQERHAAGRAEAGRVGGRKSQPRALRKPARSSSTPFTCGRILRNPRA
jgi:hypothetical protein